MNLHIPKETKSGETRIPALPEAVKKLVALGAALFGPTLRRHVDLDRFRFGSAVALGTMGAAVAGLVPADSPLPLVALVLAAPVAYLLMNRWLAGFAYRVDLGAGADLQPVVRPRDLPHLLDQPGRGRAGRPALEPPHARAARAAEGAGPRLGAQPPRLGPLGP